MSPTVSEAVQTYTSARRLTELKKPEAVAVKQFMAFATDLRLDRITRAKVREWIKVLREESGQSEATIRRRLGSMSTIYAHATDDDAGTSANPFCRHRLSTSEAGYRLPFDQSHLASIDRWLHERAGERPTGLIIRLLRATGARPLEIGGLERDDLRVDAPIPHLLIQPNTLRLLKTASSRRMVPLVGDGLLAAQIIAGHGQSGPAFPPTCWETGSLSARLNKALRAAGVPKSSALTAYSFRHTMAEALRTTDAPFDVQQAILGHARTTITERYGSRMSPVSTYGT
jgi:integrase